MGLRCSNCQADNRPERRFCFRCGTPLSIRCSICNFDNEPNAAYCGGCGAQLPVREDHHADQAVEGSKDPAILLRGERRRMTVGFCDLVGFTKLSTILDPEDLGEVMQQYDSACMAVIDRFEGRAKYRQGDGILVYFGHPKAHGDDRERAVRCALEMIEAVNEIEALEGQTLQARVGVATGSVAVIDMVGDQVAEAPELLGETTNLAARLQTEAQPDSVVIDDATYREAGAAFDCTALGRIKVKGFDEPVRAWKVDSLRQAESRFKIASAAGLTPLVDREREVDLLVDRWEVANSGEGQVVLLSGEAGLGKSRIVQALCDKLQDEPRIETLYQCSPYHTNSALHPVKEQLKWSAGFAPTDSNKVQWRKFEELLRQSTDRVTEIATPIAALLSIGDYENSSSLDSNPKKRRENTLRAIETQIVGLARKKPVLMILEDAQWIDPTSLELWETLVDVVQHLRVLMLVTYRPDFECPWGGHPHVTQLSLSRLPRKHIKKIVRTLSRSKEIPAARLEEVVEKSDGVPLYAEEFAKTVVEELQSRSMLNIDEGEESLLTPVAVPSSLKASLVARLDRLASDRLDNTFSAREVAQVGAAIGRLFSKDLLAEVIKTAKGSELWPLHDPELDFALDQLVESGLLFRRHVQSETVYRFKHALVQQAAYECMLRSTRKKLHGCIARVLKEGEESGARESEPEVLAHHLTEAGLLEEAIDHWRRAGKESSRRSANSESINYFRRAIQLIDGLPQTPQTELRELEIQNDLGAVQMASHGFADKEVERTYRRAMMLGEKLGKPDHLYFPALAGTQLCNLVLGAHDTAKTLGEQCLDFAERDQDVVHRIEAHRHLGAALFWMGEEDASRRHFEAVINLYDVEQHKDLAFTYGSDPKAGSFVFLSLTLLLLGFPDQALQRNREGNILANELSHQHTTAYVQLCSSMFFDWRGDREEARKRAGHAIESSSSHGFPFWLWWAHVVEGRAKSAVDGGGHASELRDGIEQMETGIGAFRRTGAGVAQTYFLAALAEAKLSLGDTAAALHGLDEALAIAAANNERLYEPELYRLRGETLQRRDADASEISEALTTAFNLAKSRGLKWWELRSALSLARFQQQSGRVETALGPLAEVCDWFTEGADTRYLKEARELLNRFS